LEVGIWKRKLGIFYNWKIGGGVKSPMIVYPMEECQTAFSYTFMVKSTIVGTKYWRWVGARKIRGNGFLW